MASTPVTLPRIGGGSTDVVWFNVTYVRQDPDKPNICYVGVLGAEPGDPIGVAQSATATITALVAAAGFVVSGQPFAPFAVFQIAGDVPAHVIGTTQAMVRQVADRAGLVANCALSIGDEPVFNVLGTRAAATTALADAWGPSNPAGGGGGFVNGRIELIGFALIDGATGVPTAAQVPSGLVSLRAPYVPGSGLYELEVLPATVPAGTILQVTVQPESVEAMSTVLSTAPPLVQPYHIAASFKDAAGLGVDTTFQLWVWRLTP